MWHTKLQLLVACHCGCSNMTSSLGVCKNIWSEISDPKIRRSDPKFRISDPIFRFRIFGIGYPKNFGFSDRIRIGIFQKFQRTRSENPVTRSENPVSDPKTRWSDPKSSDIRKVRISENFGSDSDHNFPDPKFSDIRIFGYPNFRISEFSDIRIFGSDPIRYPTLNTPIRRYFCIWLDMRYDLILDMIQQILVALIIWQ